MRTPYKFRGTCYTCSWHVLSIQKKSWKPEDYFYVFKTLLDVDFQCFSLQWRVFDDFLMRSEQWWKHSLGFLVKPHYWYLPSSFQRFRHEQYNMHLSQRFYNHLAPQFLSRRNSKSYLKLENFNSKLEVKRYMLHSMFINESTSNFKIVARVCAMRLITHDSRHV